MTSLVDGSLVGRSRSWIVAKRCVVVTIEHEYETLRRKFNGTFLNLGDPDLYSKASLYNMVDRGAFWGRHGPIFLQ